MSSKILTFEVPQGGSQVEIHGNEEGLQELCRIIQRLLKAHGNEHEHLFTPEWGGGELSQTKEGEVTNTLFNKVTIYLWREQASTPGVSLK